MPARTAAAHGGGGHYTITCPPPAHHLRTITPYLCRSTTTCLYTFPHHHGYLPRLPTFRVRTFYIPAAVLLCVPFVFSALLLFPPLLLPVYFTPAHFHTAHLYYAYVRFYCFERSAAFGFVTRSMTWFTYFTAVYRTQFTGRFWLWLRGYITDAARRLVLYLCISRAHTTVRAPHG